MTVHADPAADDARYCPHCYGPLVRPRSLLQHPCFDDARHMVIGSDGREFQISRMLWNILCAFRGSFNRLLRHEYLIACRGPDIVTEDPVRSYVSVQIMHLRVPLSHTPFEIINVRGEGYRMAYRRQALAPGSNGADRADGSREEVS
jgi:DNA-binding winged helix-turn-helix (wHTH) protein